MPMFDGIEMQVVHVGFEIGLTPDEVLSIAPPPYAAFPASAPNG